MNALDMLVHLLMTMSIYCLLCIVFIKVPTESLCVDL